MSARSRPTCGRAPAVSSILTATTLLRDGFRPVSGLIANFGFAFGFGFGAATGAAGLLGGLTGGGAEEMSATGWEAQPPPFSTVSATPPAIARTAAMPAAQNRVRGATTGRVVSTCFTERTSR